jgi:hypothetical protein
MRAGEVKEQDGAKESSSQPQVFRREAFRGGDGVAVELGVIFTGKMPWESEVVQERWSIGRG